MSDLISTVKNNGVNLCDSCYNEYPDCSAENVLFGDGVGKDNICCCSEYCPLWTRETLMQARMEGKL